MANLKEIQDAYDKMDVLEMLGRFHDADKFYENNFYLFQYDYNGNWIGAIPNENGWTA